jgi:hypothetical protein
LPTETIWEFGASDVSSIPSSKGARFTGLRVTPQPDMKKEIAKTSNNLAQKQ